MYSYDRRFHSRSAHQLGTLGFTMEQISDAVREHMNLLPNTSVNLSFGAIVSKDRQLKVPFSAMTSGKIASGNVIFEILEANSRQWAGESIILNGRVEVA